MDLLSRARSFAAKKGSRLAAAIVPLAALAVSAIPSHAAAVFGSGTCNVTGPTQSGSTLFTGSCSVGQQSATGGNSSANWLDLSGNGTLATTGTLTFTGTGSANGTFLSGNIPASYDFGVNKAASWSVTVTLTGNAIAATGILSDIVNGLSATYTNTGATTGSQEVTGNGNINMGTGFDVTGYSISLSVTCATTCNITIPSGTSIDLNPVIQSSVPEPATLLLVPGAGALLLLAARRKRRANK